MSKNKHLSSDEHNDDSPHTPTAGSYIENLPDNCPPDKDPELHQVFLRIKARHRRLMDGKQEAAEESAGVRYPEILPPNPVAPKPPQVPVLTPKLKHRLAPFPTHLCRVSFFFPLSPRDMRERAYVRDMTVVESSWGSISYSGPQLSVYEEDVLLAILSLVFERPEQEMYLWDDGKQSLAYRGSISAILKALGYDKLGKSGYSRVTSALQLLHGAAVKITSSDGKFVISNVLLYSAGDGKNKISVAVNPYFYDMFLKGRVTRLDLVRRGKLKKSTSKAIYRFITSHREKRWKGHWETLAKTLNMDLELEPRTLRRTLREAIEELKAAKILLEESGFIGQDIVRLSMIATVELAESTPPS